MSYSLTLTNESLVLHNSEPQGYFNIRSGRIDGDLELVALLKTGDDNAFRLLVGKYKDRIYRIAYTYTGDKHKADDVTQEVFLKVYLKIKTFKERSTFFTWLYRVAVNECHNATRKSWRTLLALDAPFSDEDSSTLADVLKGGDIDMESRHISQEQAKFIKTLIDALSDKYRAVYILRNIDGLSYDEIADTLKISVAKVKIWLFRAREKINDKSQSLHQQNTEY